VGLSGDSGGGGKREGMMIGAIGCVLGISNGPYSISSVVVPFLLYTVAQLGHLAIR